MARALQAPRRPPGHRGSVRLTRLLRRLRGRTPAELRERLGQRLAARAERHGLGRALGLADERLDRVLAAGAPRDPARLLADFRGADRPRFFPGPSDPRATAAALHARCPGHEAAILARAARILEGRFDLLGYDDLSYGRPIDWHRDPVAQRRAPLVHWSRVPYLDPAVVGDHKVVWELNRHQFLVTLGQAYAFTGDERFARGFAELVTQWVDANPPKLGINWASSLEVSFRAISWCWALHLFRHSPELSPALYGRMLGMLAVHGRHLERYLSTYFSPNTHLTGEALGLVYLGLLFPELAHAPRWLARGWGILEEWMPRHVRPDGVYFEQASQYHRYTTEFYAQLVALA
ncbi:MAG TPA: heparinase II/III family protein, partial [Gemmatimonadaceae bacterium]